MGVPFSGICLSVAAGAGLALAVWPDQKPVRSPARERDSSQSCPKRTSHPGRRSDNQPPDQGGLPMLADAVDHVIGVDTHRDHHSAAVTNRTGAPSAHTQAPAPRPGIATCWRSPANTRLGDAYGRSRAAAATAPDSPRSCSLRASRSSRLTAPNAPRDATAQNPISWTPSGRPAKRWRANITPNPANAAHAKHSECC